MSTYVYGVIRAAHPALPDGLTGVGHPPRPVRTLREGTVAAIVGDCPEELRPKRRDLLAHQHVLTTAAADGPVLPMRFGSLAADDATVREALAQQADGYLEQLEQLSGTAEYNVKAVHDETAVLRLVVAEHPEIRDLREAARAADGGTYEDRIRLGELIANAVRARADQDTAAVEAALVPHAERHTRSPDSAGEIMNLSFLVEHDAVTGFLNALDRFRKANPHLDLKVNGPLPPYSFVRTSAAGTV